MVDRTFDYRGSERLVRKHRSISNGVVSGWQDVSNIDALSGALVTYSPYILTNPPWKQRLSDRTSATTTMLVIGGQAQGGTVTAKVMQYAANTLTGVPHLWGTEVSTSRAYHPAGFTGESTYDANADSKARMAFVKQCLKAQRQFEAGVFSGEFREAVRMIRNPMKGIRYALARHVDRVKKRGTRWRNRLTLSQANKIVADSWLEAQFGLRPLMSDVDSAAKALAEVTTYRRPSASCTGKSSSRVNVPGPTVHIEDRGFIRVTTRVETTNEFIVRYKGSISLKEKGWDATSEAFGLNWSSFIPTLYELAPWSFFIDYFTNLNEIINALTFNEGLLSWCERGYYQAKAWRVSTSFAPINLQTGYVWSEIALPGESSGYVTSFRKEREPYLNTFVPNFMFEVPGLKQSVNVAALAVSAGGVTKLLRSKVF